MSNAAGRYYSVRIYGIWLTSDKCWDILELVKNKKATSLRNLIGGNQ
jgi:hypothetical protein